MSILMEISEEWQIGRTYIRRVDDVRLLMLRHCLDDAFTERMSLILSINPFKITWISEVAGTRINYSDLIQD